MRGAILDAGSLGPAIDLTPITSCLDNWEIFDFSGEKDLKAKIQSVDVILTNKVALDNETLMAAPELKLVSVMATGTNNIDLVAAKSRGITVSNAVAYATPSVVQHTMSLMLALSNNLTSYVADVRSGSWQQSQVFCLLDHPIVELAGKTLGIVGYGELGRGVAKLGEAFGMRVLVSERKQATTASTGRTLFADVLKESDYISLHCPLNDETENLINDETLSQMKASAFLINTARGGLVNSSDLIKALRLGTIKGAAVDVVDHEPPPMSDLITNTALPNLLVTPHNAWGAIESRNRLILQMQENIKAFLAGSPVRVVS